MAREKKCVREKQYHLPVVLSSDAWSKQPFDVTRWRSPQLQLHSSVYNPSTAYYLYARAHASFKSDSRKVLLDGQTLFPENLPSDTMDRELVSFFKHSGTVELYSILMSKNSKTKTQLAKKRTRAWHINKEINSWLQPWYPYPRHLGESSGKQPLQPMLYSSIHLLWSVPWFRRVNPELGRLHPMNPQDSLIIMLFTILYALHWMTCVPSLSLRLKCTNTNEKRGNKNQNTIKERQSSTQMVLPLSQEEVHMEKCLEVVWLWRAKGFSVRDRRREIEAIKRRKRRPRGSMLSKSRETAIGYVFFRQNPIRLDNYLFSLDLSSSKRKWEEDSQSAKTRSVTTIQAVLISSCSSKESAPWQLLIPFPFALIHFSSIVLTFTDPLVHPLTHRRAAVAVQKRISWNRVVWVIPFWIHSRVYWHHARRASFGGRAHCQDSLVSPIRYKGSISRYVDVFCKGKGWARRSTCSVDAFPCRVRCSELARGSKVCFMLTLKTPTAMRGTGLKNERY